MSKTILIILLPPNCLHSCGLCHKEWYHQPVMKDRNLGTIFAISLFLPTPYRIHTHVLMILYPKYPSNAATSLHHHHPPPLYLLSNQTTFISHQRLFFFWFYYSLASHLVLFHSIPHTRSRVILLKHNRLCYLFKKNKKGKNIIFQWFPHTLDWGGVKLCPQGERIPCTCSSLSLKCFSLCTNNIYSYLELQIEHQFLKDVTSPMTRSVLSDMLFFFRILTSFFNCALTYVTMHLMTVPASGLSFPQKHGLYQSDCWL